MTCQLPATNQNAREISESSQGVKLEIQDDGPVVVLNYELPAPNSTRERGEKRRTVQYAEYAHLGRPSPYHMPFPVYAQPPPKMARSSKGRPVMMPPPLGNPMPYGMPPHHPHAQLMFAPGPHLPMAGMSAQPGHMPQMMMMAPPPMMQQPQIPAPGSKWVLVDPVKGTQEVYMMVKVDELPIKRAEPSTNRRPIHRMPGAASSRVDSVYDDPASEGSQESSKTRNSVTAFTFPCLITLAIISSPDNKLAVQDIYDFISENFHGFSEDNTDWKNNVRLTLSMSLFARSGNKVTDNGNREEWTIAAGRVEILIEEVRRTVERNKSTLDRLQMKNIENLDLMVCGEFDASIKSRATSCHTALSPSTVRSCSRISTETSSTNMSAPPVPLHRKPLEVFGLDEDDKHNVVAIDDADK